MCARLRAFSRSDESGSPLVDPQAFRVPTSVGFYPIRKPEVTHPIEETVGEKESRGTTLNGTQVHSVRLPGYVIGVEAISGARDERLSLRHDAGSGAEPYLQGTLLAIRKVQDHVGLVRGLDRIMA